MTTMLVIIFGVMVAIGSVYKGNGYDGSNSLFMMAFPAVFLILFILALFGLGGYAFYSYLWLLAGKEIIEIDRHRLTVSRRLFHITRTKEYPLGMLGGLAFIPNWTFDKGSEKGGTA